MAEQVIQLLKGDKVDSNTDYRDGLPVNISGVIREVLGSSGYMLQMPGLTLFGVGVSLSNHSFYYPDDGEAQFQLNTNGQAQYDTGDGFVTIPGEWLLKGSADAYECRMTETLGTFSSGTVGSWLSLDTTRTWARDNNEAVIGTLEIREIGQEEILVSATITLLAPVNLENRSYSTGNQYPAGAQALFRLNANGNAEYSIDAGSTWNLIAGEWKLGGAAPDFQCRMVGSFSSGITGEWLDLNETRTWSAVIGGGEGTESSSGTLTIRTKNGWTELASATISLTAISAEGGDLEGFVNDHQRGEGTLEGQCSFEIVNIIGLDQFAFPVSDWSEWPFEAIETSIIIGDTAEFDVSDLGAYCNTDEEVRHYETDDFLASIHRDLMRDIIVISVIYRTGYDPPAFMLDEVVFLVPQS